ncbi:phosphatidylserine decarboxylase [Agyrium rufum]|nr:phosphatidylserine decarboxylase [Agyrium rufum]
MVRMTLPHRLKSFNGATAGGAQPSSRSSSPVRGNPQCLILRTTVVKGRNLAPKDKNGSSDPYLVLNLGDTRQSTPTISKSLNPEWGVTMDLPIMGTQSMLLEVVCWDKDRFGKDYLGEFDVVIDDLFMNGQTKQPPHWYALKSNRKSHKKKKSSMVCGDVQLQFELIDPASSAAPPQEILARLQTMFASSPSGDAEDDLEAGRIGNHEGVTEAELLEDDMDLDTSDETEDLTKSEVVEKRKKKLRLAKLRRKTKARAYEFTGGSEVTGIAFIEISRITDLPPERNVTRTSFDMDPFVIASLGRKTYRTRVIRHNLNPVFDEKMVFQVLRYEQNYSISLTVVDRDKLSGNDFIGTANFPMSTLINSAPQPDSKTGLYPLREPPDQYALPTPKHSKFRLPLSRSASGTSLNKMSRPGLTSRNSHSSMSSQQDLTSLSTMQNENINGHSHQVYQVTSNPASLNPASAPSSLHNLEGTDDNCHHPDDPDLKSYTLPLVLKHKEKWDDKHPSQLYIKAKYLPYPALRQQFWRAMLKQYDTDESARVSKVELTTMLDTLGSTLKESTIDGFFTRFAKSSDDTTIADLTFDQAVICLEDQLKAPTATKKTMVSKMKDAMPHGHLTTIMNGEKGSPQSPKFSLNNDAPTSSPPTPAFEGNSEQPLNADPEHSAIPAIAQDKLDSRGEIGDFLARDDLTDERGEEHVIEISECPLCHQPRMNKRSDADIITHIATCASHDWRQVNNIVMAGFVTSSQAQRKWYSKVITKIGYGGYKLGANSANILVQDRLTGQINEERMSVYVRLGIRLLYKGLKSRDMETKRIRKLLKTLSIKQGRKYDNPASARDIRTFINFHQLDMSEVARKVEDFKTFNEFFYRALKPNARPCSAPDNPRIIVSPADSRSVVFNTMTDATKIWVKGREFTVERLLGNTYPEDAKRYVNGALGIFRLAPQDYHRFHVPVDGIMGQPKLIGQEYYTVNPMAIRSALDVYGENVRYVVPIDSVAHGRVMVICVGAMMVGSTVITRQKGERVGRAEELGYFKFGGSTILLLFEPEKMRFDDDIVDNSSEALETLLRVGMSIGHHPDQPQHTPDMRKAEENVTNEERQEAKRRIEGSLAPEREGMEEPVMQVQSFLRRSAGRLILSTRPSPSISQHHCSSLLTRTLITSVRSTSLPNGLRFPPQSSSLLPYLRRTFASDAEKETQSEPEADGAVQTQHADNSIAQSSPEQQSSPSSSSTTEAAANAAENVKSAASNLASEQQAPTETKQSGSASESLLSSASEAVSNAAQSAKDAVIEPFAAAAGSMSGGRGGRSSEYQPREDRRQMRGDRGDRGREYQPRERGEYQPRDRGEYQPRDRGEYQPRERHEFEPRAPAPPAPPSSTVYVGNLFFDVTNQALQEEFTRFGTVRKVRIVTDARGLSKGFAYVEFEDTASAESAIGALNGQNFEGRRLNVQYAARPTRTYADGRSRGGVSAPSEGGGAKNPPSKTIFIGNMSFDMTDQDLNDLFRGVQNVIDVRVAIDRRTGQPRGFAHADFIDVPSAEKAMAGLEGREFYGRRLRVDYNVALRKEGREETRADSEQ